MAKRATAKRVKKATRPAPRKPASRRPKPASRAAAPKRVLRKRPARPQLARERTSAAPTPPRAASIEARLKTVDRDLVKLLNQRMELALQSFHARLAESLPLFDAQWEQEFWTRVDGLNQGPLPATTLRSVFREVLSAARSRLKTFRIAYLGPPFSYTHLAAIERFGKSADLVPVNTIAAVFEEVNRGHADYGIVPIENSTDGRIVDTLDMFTRLPLRICGEVQLAVHHNLLSRSQRGEIVEVYSKPQALSQCREWLARNMPQASVHEVTSTSTAAQLARTKPGAAAIASRQAAVEYDLQIVAERIEDNSNNVTRFAVIGDDETRPTSRDRTALLLQIPHTPGSLSDSLQAFKKAKINLTWIESFPLRGPEVGYLFFLDFEGHVKEPRIQKALAELERKAVRLEVLGSFPRSDPLE